MMTIYNVVPAYTFFDAAAPLASFPSRAMAERQIALRAEEGDETEYGIFETRLISGSAKMTYGRTMHVVGDRRIITGKHYLGGYSAHDDGMGEDGSPYGHGATPEAAIADLVAALDALEAEPA